MRATLEIPVKSVAAARLDAVVQLQYLAGGEQVQGRGVY
jgi:hypothetical protein